MLYLRIQNSSYTRRLQKTRGKNENYAGKVKTTEIYNSSANIYFACEDQIFQSWTNTIGQIVTKRNVSLVFRNEIDYTHCDAIFTVVQKDNVSILTWFVFIGNLCQT